MEGPADWDKDEQDIPKSCQLDRSIFARDPKRTYSQLDIAAALKLPSRVGAFPIFLSGVNSPVVILLTIIGIGSLLLDLLESPDPRRFGLFESCELGLSVVESIVSSTVTRRRGVMVGVLYMPGPGGTGSTLGTLGWSVESLSVNELYRSLQGGLTGHVGRLRRSQPRVCRRQVKEGCE